MASEHLKWSWKTECEFYLIYLNLTSHFCLLATGLESVAICNTFFKRQRQSRWKLKRHFICSETHEHLFSVCVWIKVSSHVERSTSLCGVMIKEAVASGDPIASAEPPLKARRPAVKGHWLEQERVQHKPKCLGRKSFCQLIHPRRGYHESWRWLQIKWLLSVAGFRIKPDLFYHFINRRASQGENRFSPVTWQRNKCLRGIH